MNCKSTIQDWQDSFLFLEENKFFNIIRMYLGEIKTPYNKQRLIEQLASYIKNEENSNVLLELLDDFDIKVITAICYIANPTRQVLTDFFAGEYTVAEIYTELSSLTQRLIIFTKKEIYGNKINYFINPLIWNKLSDYIGIQNILVEANVQKKNNKDSFFLNTSFLAAFISLLNHNKISCKNDGELKKNDKIKIETVFPGKEKCVQLLITSFINLGLIRDTEKKLEVDYQKLQIFSLLEESFQYAFICTSACTRFSRDSLKKQSQIFLDLMKSIPDSGYTKSTIIKLIFLLTTQFSEDNGIGNSRFSKILQAAKQERFNLSEENTGSVAQMLLDSAISFGFLKLMGTDKDGNEIFGVSEEFYKNKQENLKVLNIDSAFTVTMMPDLKFKSILPLTQFLQIKKYGLVCEFEITRQSASYAFDRGFTSDDIIEKLRNYIQYELPQNLLVTVLDWYNVYSSAVIYQGYILKVSQSYITFAENNPKIKNHIKEKLAEGVYILDIPVTKDISGFIDESGLDFIGKVRTGIEVQEKMNFPLLRKPSILQYEKQVLKKIDYSKACVHINLLKDKLKKLELDEIQFKTLSDKVNQRVIINEKQLSLSHIRTEVLEVAGTDYIGKIHLIEAAINAEEEMEITLPQFNNQNEYFTMIGKPLGITRQTSDAIVRVEFLPEHNIENLFVSKITHLRRLRF